MLARVVGLVGLVGWLVGSAARQINSAFGRVWQQAYLRHQQLHRLPLPKPRRRRRRLHLGPTGGGCGENAPQRGPFWSKGPLMLSARLITRRFSQVLATKAKYSGPLSTPLAFLYMH